MNKILITGKINGMWKNGLTGKQRGLNVFIVDKTTIFKTSVWQEIAEWAEDEWSIGDEIQLTGECCGVWEHDNGRAIEIRKPDIISVSSPQVEMKQLKKRFDCPDSSLDNQTVELLGIRDDKDDRKN